MKNWLFCFVLLQVTATCLAQPATIEIDQQVSSINKRIEKGLLSKWSYQSEEEEKSEEVIEGGTREEMISYVDDKSLVLCDYTFAGAYNTSRTQIWFHNEQPIFVLQEQADFMIDSRQIEKIWIKDGAFTKWQLHNSDIHEENTYEDVANGQTERIKKLNSLVGYIRILQAESKVQTP